MKPPKVSAQLVKRMATIRQDVDVVWPTRTRAGMPDAPRFEQVPRRPMGLGVNGLPDFWIERRADSSFWLMERMREGSEDRVLAVIPASVVGAAQASRVPLVLQEAK